MRVDSKRFTLCGTVEYLPPEVAAGAEYSFGFDMWTLGASRVYGRAEQSANLCGVPRRGA